MTAGPFSREREVDILRRGAAVGTQRWIGVFAGALVATAASILLLDRPAATFAHDDFHGAMLFVALTHIVDPILPLAAFGFLVIGGALLLGWRLSPAVRLAFCVCVACLLAVVVKDQLKYAFGRTWPETWTNGNPSWIKDGVMTFVPFHGGAGWSSFPSGHMTMITAPFAVLMAVARPLWRPVMSIPIALVAGGLFGADYHFVGDMIAGVTLGAVCAAIAVRTLLPELRPSSHPMAALSPSSAADVSAPHPAPSATAP